MDTPLLGTPQNNYRFFYCSGISVVTSLLLLFIITIIVGNTVHQVNITTRETQDLIKDMNLLLPDAKFATEFD